MWSIIEERLKKSPAQTQVAKTILELGLRIGEDKKIYCGPIEVSPMKMARAIGVDRRVVNEAIRSILSYPDIKEIFAGGKVGQRQCRLLACLR